MVRRNLGVHQPRLHHEVDLRGHRMILVQLAELAAPVQKQRAVADRDPPQPVLHQAGHHQRGAHPLGLGVAAGVLADRLVGQFGHPAQDVGRARLERLDIGEVELEFRIDLGQHDLRGHVARRVAAHAVGQDHKARLGPHREIGGDRILLIVARALAYAGSHVIARLTRSPHHSRPPRPRRPAS